MSKYLETATELTKGLNSLFSSLTIGKFIRWIIVIMIISGITLFSYDNFFNSSNHYDKLDRKIKIIENVKNLNSNDSILTKSIHRELLEILNELDPPQHTSLNTDSIVTFISENFWEYLIKSLSAILLPIFLIFTVPKGPERKNATIGAIAFIIVFLPIAWFIPDIYHIAINFVIILIAQLLALIIFQKFG